MYLNIQPKKYPSLLSPRTIAYLVIAATLGAGITTGYFSRLYLFIVAYFILFPLLTNIMLRHKYLQSPRNTERVLVGIGAINLGLVIALTGFPLSIMALVMFVAPGVTVFQFGMKGLMMAAIPFFLSAGLGYYFLSYYFLSYYFLGIEIRVDSPLYLDIVALAGGFIYICYFSILFRSRHLEFIQLRNHARQQEKRYSELANSLSKYVSPQVWELIFSGHRGVKLENQRKRLTVFFSDIKGFTDISEELEPEALTELLNQYLDAMSKIALKYGGTIDKFIGDSIMVFFGDPKSRGTRRDALAAVSMAIEMQKIMQVLRKRWTAKGIETPLEIRIGINTGYCTVGNFGTNSRLDYTALGREVNLASRLESACVPNQILLSYETWSLVKDQVLCKSMGEINVKGFSRPVPIYRVLDLRRNLGSRKTYFEHEGKGFSLNLDTTRIDLAERKKILMALDEASRELNGVI